MKISNKIKTVAAGSAAVVAAGVKAGVASAATTFVRTATHWVLVKVFRTVMT